MPKRLEFHISYKCNNNCIFCGEYFRLEKNRNKFVPLEQIKKELLAKKKGGLAHLTLTGGEPTFHPDFLEILRFAKGLEFKTYISTNGGLFAYENFCRQAAPYLDEICFSIHGYQARLHNFHTRNSGSFKILAKAMDNFGRYLIRTKGLSNTVVTKYNFEFLPDIMDLAAKKGITHMLFSNVAAEGRAWLDYNDLAVSLREFKKMIPIMAKEAKRRRLELRFFGLPLCIMGKKYSAYSNDLWWSPRLTLEKGERKLILDEIKSVKPVRHRVKSVKCASCREKERCGGIFKKYFDDFGDKEIRAIN